MEIHFCAFNISQKIIIASAVTPLVTETEWLLVSAETHKRMDYDSDYPNNQTPLHVSLII